MAADIIILGIKVRMIIILIKVCYVHSLESLDEAILTYNIPSCKEK